MILVGLAAAAVLTLPGWIPARRAPSLLIQLQILLDCSDGELARWRRQFSPAGIYLDRIAPLRDRDGAADRARHPRRRRLGRARHYTTLGLVAAVLVLMVRTETRARPRRARRGRAAARRGHAWRWRRRAPPGCGGCAARSAASRSSARSWRSRRRCWRSPPRSSTSRSATSTARACSSIALVPVAAITAAGHLFAILTSEPAAMSASAASC